MNKVTNILLFCAVLLLASCQEQTVKNPDDSIMRISGYAQGTTYTILYYDSLQRNIQDKVDSILARIDSSVSTYKANSIISRFNKGKDCALIDDHFLDLFFLSDEVYDASGGAFDPTVKLITGVWGFGSDTLVTDTLYNSITRKSKRDSLIYNHRDSVAFELLDYVGWDLLMLDGDIFYNDLSDMNDEEYQDNFICKSDSLVQLSFDAVAQGYSADIIGDYLTFELNIQDFIIEIGGEILAQGYKPSGKKWKVSIEHPTDTIVGRQPGLAFVEMGTDFRALAVSGNYRNYKKGPANSYYGHTIDPRSGFPIKNRMISASIFSDNCATADAYATAIMAMGIEEAVPFVELNPYAEIEAFLVYETVDGDLETYTSSGLEGYIIVPNDSLQP
jgi:thiamine biosynthesis lipoprotein